MKHKFEHCPRCQTPNHPNNIDCVECQLPLRPLEPKKDNWKTGLIVTVIVLTLVGFAYLSPKSDDKTPTVKTEVVHPILGKKPEQSAWGGEVPEVRKYLQRNLNDFDSSEYVDWSPVSEVKRGEELFWGVRLRLRAKNAFGAYIVKDIYFYIKDGEVKHADGI